MLIDNKTVVAENSFFPSNFTNVDLPEAKLTTSNFLLTPNDTVTVSEYQYYKFSIQVTKISVIYPLFIVFFDVGCGGTICLSY